ncbi:MAG: DNA translocase FtsK 4TM domain-containing protein [Deltaproteobacteria bacterium]
MKEQRINEFKGLLLAAAALIILLSLVSFDLNDLSFYTSHPNVPPHNLIRIFGAYLAAGLFFLFGWAAFIVPVFLGWVGVQYFRNEPPVLGVSRIGGLSILLLSLGSLIGLITMSVPAVGFWRTGIFGFVSSKFIVGYLGMIGGYIVFSTLILLSTALVTEELVSSILNRATGNVQPVLGLFLRTPEMLKAPAALFKREKKPQAPKPEKAQKPLPKVRDQVHEEEEIEEESPQAPVKPKVRIKEEPAKAQEAKPKPPRKVGDYQLPSLDLFDSPPPLEARQIKEDLQNSAHVLEETLEDFGISVKVTDIERGPIITRYELEPAPGVKINKIVGLGDDIALAMKAQSVRIVAPIPGKARVGVEVPNGQSSLVYLKEILSAKEFQGSESKLTLALGKDIAGAALVAQLDSMPHLLIAGTTGSGKTVCVNSLILSILMKASPDELKFVMVDPKMVELAPYNGLPHLLCPVVTESKKASGALHWVVAEMERRYRLLAEVAARNITAYNQKMEKDRLPYIVVVVDEFADLMVVARDEVESAITRLAQLSRAVGIHLILATQRPSVDVITGVIKANLPARISFKVASKVDSRTVLDMNGADKLLGRGDMLFLKPTDSKLTRAQCALVTDAEIERVVDFIKAQAEPVYDDQVLNAQQKAGTPGGGEKDDMYDEAVRVIIESGQASVSILQRRMRLGYTRAARIIDMMEQDGLVGPYEGSKPRKLLVDRDEWLKNQVMKGKQEG